MDSVSFTPGYALLSSDSTAAPWSVVFEDEGPAGYFYACDRTQGTHNDNILDAMLIYNTASLNASTGGPRERIASIEWSPSGLQAVLYLDGRPQALADFAARRGFCRMDFPNFISHGGDTWRKDTHAWSDAEFVQFEAAKFEAAL